MVRRGWSAVPASAGWYEVFRGPRLPSVFLERAAEGQGQGSTGAADFSLTRAMALRSTSVRVSRQSPHSRRSLGKSYQQDLQVAICHCSSGGGRRCGEEWAAFKKAQAQDVVSPVPEQIAHTEKFVERAKQRVLHAEECVQWAQEWQVVWEKELKEAEERREARATSTRSSSGCPTSKQLAQLHAQIQQRSSSSVESDPVAKRPWRREEFRCSNAEEVMEWMHDRQMDIQEELFRSNASEVARLSSLVVEAATSLQPVSTP